MLIEQYRKQISLVVACWGVLCVLNVYKAPKCTGGYWGQQAGMVLLCVAFTGYSANVLTRGGRTIGYPNGIWAHLTGVSSESQSSDKKSLLERGGDGGSGSGSGGGSQTESVSDLKWDAKSLINYPLFAAGAGFLGGFLGIGGGMIISPVLLELGMAPESNQATTAVFVLLSSSLASVQFFIMGSEMPQYIAWFCTWVAVSTFIGQTLIDYVLRIYKRSSIIVLSIASIIGVSMVMMTITGSMEVVDDIKNDANMGMSPYKLCK